jgi:hypothetical protein
VNATAEAARITGPTIMLGDGSYFDYTDPESSQMTIEDFAYGLAYTCRFRGQTRARLEGNRRVFYSVAEHCVRGARWVFENTGDRELAYDFLMHEGGEPTCGDDPGPMKLLCPDKKALEKRCEAAAHKRFGVTMRNPAYIKEIDLRMLATEQRDLMPQSGGDKWRNAEDHPRDLPEPFGFRIVPYVHPDVAAVWFLSLYRQLKPAGVA